MSYFSESLDAYLSAEKLANRTVADEIGMSDSDVSRWRRGTMQPTKKALARLLPIMPESVRVPLGVAWLRDECPDLIKEDILVMPAQPAGVADLSRSDWQAAMDYFLANGEHNPLMRETLVGLHRLMVGGAEDSEESLALVAERKDVVYPKPPRKRKD